MQEKDLGWLRRVDCATSFVLFVFSDFPAISRLIYLSNIFSLNKGMIYIWLENVGKKLDSAASINDINFLWATVLFLGLLVFRQMQALISCGINFGQYWGYYKCDIRLTNWCIKFLNAKQKIIKEFISYVVYVPVITFILMSVCKPFVVKLVVASTFSINLLHFVPINN